MLRSFHTSSLPKTWCKMAQQYANTSRVGATSEAKRKNDRPNLISHARCVRRAAVAEILVGAPQKCRGGRQRSFDWLGNSDLSDQGKGQKASREPHSHRLHHHEILKHCPSTFKSPRPLRTRCSEHRAPRHNCFPISVQYQHVEPICGTARGLACDHMIASF